MKKTILTILLCCVMVLEITGCGKNTASSENNTGSTSNENKNETSPESNTNNKNDSIQNVKIKYYNPVTNKLCTDYVKENSKTGTKTGCMKWYVYREDDATYTMILDHNSTARSYYNYDDTNTSMGTRSGKEIGRGYNEVGYDLAELTKTSGWQVTPRLITGQEVADIVGNTSWNESNVNNKGIVFDTENCQRTCAQGKNKYSWLIDNLNFCTTYGCNVADNEDNWMLGYWTSTANTSNSNGMWDVEYFGTMSCGKSASNTYNGVRPVVTIPKSI